MNILFSASELFPFLKTGGLADVAYALPNAFAKQKHPTFLVIPGYTSVLKQLVKLGQIGSIIHPVTGEVVEIWKSQELKPVRLIVLKNAHFENKVNPYVDETGIEWQDNFETFSLFSWASAYLATHQKLLRYEIDIAVSNDWQSGLMAAYIDDYNKAKKRRTSTAHIIHNIAFPGIFSAHLYNQLGLPVRYFSTEGIEYFNHISFQKAALYFADKLFTVSPQYAIEIAKYHEFGMGFEGLLSHRQQDLQGILNGVDYTMWSPLKNPHISINYGLSTVHKKKENKYYLLHKFGLPMSRERVLIGMVTRCSEQKGLDVLIDYIRFNESHRQFDFIILGTGDEQLTSSLTHLAETYSNIVFLEKYDEIISYQIVAGSDVFLMPSRFEPCGLTQLYSMKFGTLPLVNPTGGLKDSVTSFDGNNKKEATGFYLDKLSVEGLGILLNQIDNYYKNKSLWKKLIQNAMRTNFSWQQSAEMYLTAFTSIINENKNETKT